MKKLLFMIAIFGSGVLVTSCADELDDIQCGDGLNDGEACDPVGSSDNGECIDGNCIDCNDAPATCAANPDS